jgi:hypothetical protein
MLEETISDRLKRKLLCLVPEEELRRVWPELEDQLSEVERFAADRQWRVFSYIKGRGAIFVRKVLS